ncbi:MAG: response regulator [Pseudoxanthomonas sp.]
MASAQPAKKGVALVVDDEMAVRMCTSDVLADMGYEVVEAGSAEDALHALADGLVPDVLITDQLMPGMSGADLAREVTLRHPHAAVVLVSGYTSVQLDPGLVLLNKPFRMRDLVASVETATAAVRER